MLKITSAQLEAMGQELLSKNVGLNLGPTMLGCVSPLPHCQWLLLMMTMGRASCSMLADVTMFGVVFQMFLHFQCAIAGKEKLGIRILVVCPVTPQCKRAELTVSMSGQQSSQCCSYSYFPFSLVHSWLIVGYSLITWMMHLFVYHFGSFGPFLDEACT